MVNFICNLKARCCELILGQPGKSGILNSLLKWDKATGKKAPHSWYINAKEKILRNNISDEKVKKDIEGGSFPEFKTNVLIQLPIHLSTNAHTKTCIWMTIIINYKISFYINDSKLIGIMSIKKEVGKGNTIFYLTNYSPFEEWPWRMLGCTWLRKHGWLL